MFTRVLTLALVTTALVPGSAAAATAANTFANAPTVTGAGPHSVAYDTDGATLQNGEPDHAGGDYGKSVWVKWTPATTTNVSIDNCGDNATFGTTVRVYKGPAAGAGFGDLVPLSFNPNGGEIKHYSCEAGIQTWTPVAGQTYYLAVVRSLYVNTADAGGKLLIEQSTAKPPVAFTGDKPLQTGAKAKLTFTSPGAVAFKCTLDGADHGCSANGDNGTFTHTFGDHKSHTFTVRAVNRWLTTGDPTTWTFTADGAAPETIIDSAPPAIAGPYPVAFHASESGATFTCKLDVDPPTPCSSPWTVAATAVTGGHAVQVFATDKWGNVDKTPAYQKFQPVAPKEPVVVQPPQKPPVQPPQPPQPPVVPPVQPPVVQPAEACAPKVTHGRLTRRGMRVRVVNPGKRLCIVSLELKAGRRVVARQVRPVAAGRTLNVTLKPRVRVRRARLVSSTR